MSSPTLWSTPSPRPIYDANTLPTTISHSPGDYPETPTRPKVHEKSALWYSLEHVIQGPNATNSSMMETVAKENNPRPLGQLVGDGAGYWVKSTDEPLTIRFPAKIDRNGQFARLGPYFNLPSTGLDIHSLKRARAQFELKLLSDEDTDCSPEAIQCSGAALEAMMILHNELEDTLTTENKTRHVHKTPFWRSYDVARGDHFSVVVSTDPIFQGLPAGKVVAPTLTRADFKKSAGLSSPSKAKAVASRAAATSCVNATSFGPRVIRISDLPDPYGHYAGLLRAHTELVDAKAVSPDILDAQGLQISLTTYDT